MNSRIKRSIRQVINFRRRLNSGLQSDKDEETGSENVISGSQFFSLRRELSKPRRELLNPRRKLKNDSGNKNNRRDLYFLLTEMTTFANVCINESRIKKNV